MNNSAQHTEAEIRRVRLFGAIFIVIGMLFAVHGGLNLIEIYNRKTPMFELEAVFTPEKGMMWSEFLAGTSVCLLGVMLGIKSGMDLKKRQ